MYILRLLVGFLTLVSCNKDNDLPGPVQLAPGERFAIEITDPSGLAFTPDLQALYTISDQSGGRVYRISFDGVIQGQVPYRGDDLEGVAADGRTGALYVVEERLRMVRQIDSQGEVIRESALPIENEQLNDGPEGLMINTDRNQLYIVNEKNPRLFIALSLDDFRVLETREIDFGGEYELKDLSGIYYDGINDELWFLSDESAAIVVTGRDLNPRRKYLTGMEKGEGIAVNVREQLIYIVNDADDELVVFRY